MGEPVTTKAGDAVSTKVADEALLASEMRAEVALWLVGLVILALTCLALWLGFRDWANPRWLGDTWLALNMLMIFGLSAMMLLRRLGWLQPRDAEAASRVHSVAVKLQPIAMLLIAAAPWILMMDAPRSAQALGIALIPWYLAVSVLVRTVALPISVTGVVAVAGSGAAFALVSGMPHATLWALFMLAAGVSMLALRGQARRTVVDAVARQLRMESAAAEARQALAVAAAERDAKALFIASASHDLKQPLAAARIWARIGLDAPPGPVRTEALAKAEQAFGSATGLVDSMLDHMRLEAGAEVARIETLIVGPILLATAQRHAPAAQAADLRIRVVPRALSVEADPALLSRALDNLVANAICHSGGRRLLLGARRQGEGVAIAVIDDGRGIVPTDRERLFEDFVQGTKPGPGGFGIGLASVRRLLDLMHGHVALDPHWACGAAFRLWLPMPVQARTVVTA